MGARGRCKGNGLVPLDGGGMEGREKVKGQGGAVRLGQPSLAAEEGASRRAFGWGRWGGPFSLHPPPSVLPRRVSHRKPLKICGKTGFSQSFQASLFWK